MNKMDHIAKHGPLKNLRQRVYSIARFELGYLIVPSGGYVCIYFVLDIPFVSYTGEQGV